MATVWFWLVLYISVGGMPLKILEAGWNHWKYFSDSIDAHYVIRITKDPAWRAMQLWKPLLTLQGLDRLNVFVLCIYIDPTLIQQDITQDQSCVGQNRERLQLHDLGSVKKTASDSKMMWIQRPGWCCMLVCRVTLGRLLSWPWRSWRSGMETLRWNAEVHRRGVPWYECISEAPRLRQSKSWPLYAYSIPRLSCAKFSACCALNCANACSKEPHTQLVDLFVSRRFSSKRTLNTSNICVRRTIRIA